MPVFTIQAPDGRKIKIQAADQATAIRGAQEYAAANPVQPQQTGDAAAGIAAPAPQPKPSIPLPFQSQIAFADRAIDAVPVAGPWLREQLGNVRGALAPLVGGTKEQMDAYTQQSVQNDPVAAGAGTLFGTVAPLAVGGMTGVGAKLLGQTGSLGSRVGMGALSGAALSGADAAARGNDVGTAMATGAVLGGGLPLVLRGVGATAKGVGATTKALTGADNSLSSGLKADASAMFDAATGGEPLAVTRNAYSRLFGNVRQVASKFRINANLDQQSVGLLQVLSDIKADVSRGGVVVDFKDLHLLRQAAQRVAQSAQGRDQAFASSVISQLDDFIKGLKPADIAGGADPSAAAKSLFTGISTWNRAIKTGLIEEAIYRAQNVGSGMENGLRIEFRKLLQNPSDRARFTAEELRLIEDVVRGSTKANLLKLLGKFGFGNGQSGNMLGGSVGMLAGHTAAGPVGGLIAGVGATAARRAAERMTEEAAQRALTTVAGARPAVPAPALPKMLPPSVLPAPAFPLLEQRQ